MIKKQLLEKILGTGKIRNLRLRFFLFACLALTLGILTPHFIYDFLPFSPRIAESILYLFNISFVFTFIWFHWRDLKEIKKENKRTEELLSDSFKTLGVANRKIDLISNFVNAYKLGYEGMSKREVIFALFNHLMVSILDSPMGILRVIDKNTMRTVTEWKYADVSSSLSFSLPNRKVIEDELIKENGHQINYYKSDEIDGFDAICVLGYIASGQALVERAFIRTLLNQILLLIHAFNLISVKQTIQRPKPLLLPKPLK
ncbi:MAG: hypothetical protein JXJ04_07195 [Spirochaetales bacterium]|nr:hypothetical protein [Spirochaetales bacterium]